MKNRTARKRQIIKWLNNLNDYYFDWAYDHVKLLIEAQQKDEIKKKLHPEQAQIVNFKN